MLSLIHCRVGAHQEMGEALDSLSRGPVAPSSPTPPTLQVKQWEGCGSVHWRYINIASCMQEALDQAWWLLGHWTTLLHMHVSTVDHEYTWATPIK